MFSILNTLTPIIYAIFYTLYSSSTSIYSHFQSIPDISIVSVHLFYNHSSSYFPCYPIIPIMLLFSILAVYFMLNMLSINSMFDDSYRFLVSLFNFINHLFYYDTNLYFYAIYQQSVHICVIAHHTSLFWICISDLFEIVTIIHSLFIITNLLFSICTFLFTYCDPLCLIISVAQLSVIF